MNLIIIKTWAFLGDWLILMYELISIITHGFNVAQTSTIHSILIPINSEEPHTITFPLRDLIVIYM